MAASSSVSRPGTTGEERQARVTARDLAAALARDWVVLLAVVFLVVLVAAAVLAHLLMPYDPLLPNIFAGRRPPFSETRDSTAGSSSTSWAPTPWAATC